jgi:DNA-binding NarL/FixJ family response regulator
MKKVIHIEDRPEWQQNVRNSLMLNTDIEPVSAYGSMEDFADASYPSADLYVCDRHFPDRRGQNPNDESWKQLLETITCLHPGMDIPIVILSSHPPKDWRKYCNVVEAIKKPMQYLDFDFWGFRNTIEHHLGINNSGGSE